MWTELEILEGDNVVFSEGGALILDGCKDGLSLGEKESCIDGTVEGAVVEMFVVRVEGEIEATNNGISLGIAVECTIGSNDGTTVRIVLGTKLGLLDVDMEGDVEISFPVGNGRTVLASIDGIVEANEEFTFAAAVGDCMGRRFCRLFRRRM